jgi:hypothetical protein
MNLTFSFKTRQLYLYFIISSRFCLVQKSCNFDMMLEIITVKDFSIILLTFCKKGAFYHVRVPGYFF